MLDRRTIVALRRAARGDDWSAAKRLFIDLVGERADREHWRLLHALASCLRRRNRKDMERIVEELLARQPRLLQRGTAEY